MANMVFDLVDPALLTNYVRTFDNEVLQAEFTLNRWLPNRNIDDLEYRIRQGSLPDVDVAEYRAWDTPAPMTGRPGVTRIRGELPPVSRQIPLGEEETLRLRALDRGNNDPIVDAIYEDSERMIRAVQARIELARGDVLVDGKVTLAENGLSLEVDYGMPLSHQVAAAVVWTDVVNATPITDLLGWVQTYRDSTGSSPGAMLMSSLRLPNLQLNAQVRAYAASGGTTPQRVNLATIQDIFSNEGLPPIVLYDTQVRVNGVQTRVIPATNVILLPAPGEPMGNTFYGPTAEAIKLTSMGLIDRRAAPGIIAVVVTEDHPVQTFTVGTGVALPVVPNPELILTADVA